ncbi:hypothetical protein HYU11_04425 [Candidatus Woesearchaeota archaeon]|nr:hypothetical protein [Candidatus Woesearchaeota archaeon]
MANTGSFEEGYPVEEVKQRYDKDPYRLQQHEMLAIQDIRQSMEKGRFDNNPEMIDENATYLQSLVKKLTMVAMTEQNEGLMNAELRTKIEEIKGLYSKLMTKMKNESKII